MAKRLVCCPSIDENSNVSFRYLYINSLNLQVEDVTDSLLPLCKDLREACCLDSLVDYAFGTKVLDDKIEDDLPFDFQELHSFELFKNTDELRLKTGSEKLLHSCLLNYYRREYDGTQQHTFFSEPTYNTPARDGVEHELSLENRTFIKKKEEGYIPETLDKGKTMAEREAEAAAAQAQAELEQAEAEAKAEDQKKAAQDKKRKQARARRADEAYRELRSQDDIRSQEYQRLRKLEEEMRANNDYLTSEYAAGNYASLPGYLPPDVFSKEYESIENETSGCAYEPKVLYAVASRLDEFGVDYTVMPVPSIDGSMRGCIFYASEQAENALRALEFFELENQLRHDDAIAPTTFLNAFQLQAMDFAYENYVDTSYVRSGDFSGNQMFRILEGGLDGHDMSVLANPAYSPAQMDALNYFMRQNWDTTPIRESGISMASIADNIFREELAHGVSESSKFFNSHSYDDFIAYDKRDSFGDYSNSYDSTHRKELYLKSEQITLEAKDRLQDFRDNVHSAYEYSQKEMNYVSAPQSIDGGIAPGSDVSVTPDVISQSSPPSSPSGTTFGGPAINPVGSKLPGVSGYSLFDKNQQEFIRSLAAKTDSAPDVGKADGQRAKNIPGTQGKPVGTQRHSTANVNQADKRGQTVSPTMPSSGTIHRLNVHSALGAVPAPGAAPIALKSVSGVSGQIVEESGKQANATKRSAPSGQPVVGKDGRTYTRNSDGTLRDSSGKTYRLDKNGQPILATMHTFQNEFTPTGRTRNDGSYVSMPYRRNATPLPGNNRSTDYTQYRNQQKAPQSSNPSNVRKRPLDELRVRSSFAERAGARIQNFGSQALRTGSHFAGTSLRMAFNNMVRSDETGTMSTGYKFGRNAVLTAQLVVDLPRMFAKPGKSYTSEAIQNAKNGLPGNKLPSKNDLPLRVKPWEETISKYTKSYEKSMNKAFGDKVYWNISKIDKQIYACGTALTAERSKAVPVNRGLKSQLKGLSKASVLSAEKDLLVSENRKLKQEIKALVDAKKKMALSPADQKKLEALLKEKKANEATIKKHDSLKKPTKDRESLVQRNRELKKEIQALKEKCTFPGDKERLLAEKLKKKKANEKLIGKKAKELKKVGPADRKATKTAKELLTQKRANEAVLRKKGRLVKDLNRLKKRKLDFDKSVKVLNKNLKAAYAAEGRLKSLPGRLVDKIVQKLYDSGDNTLSGMGQATSFAMTFSRSPITRLALRGIKKLVVKIKERPKPAKKPATPQKPTTPKPQAKPGRPVKSGIKPAKRTIGTKSGLHNAASRKIGVKGNKQVKQLFGQQKGIKVWIKQTTRKAIEAAKAAAASAKGLLGIGGAAAGGGAAAAGGGTAAAAAGAAGGPALLVILGIVVIALIGGLFSSFVVTDAASDDGRIDLSEHIGFINSCQSDLQAEINSIATGLSSETGKQYDNVFYDYNGEGNTKQILAMAYVRFGLDLSNKEAVKAYMEQLYHDSNFVDYAESDLYACANGCVERSYLCYESYDEHASQTRKSLYTASKGKGCIPSAAYSCDEKDVIGKHNDGKAMNAPCSCDNYKEETKMVESGRYVYYCQGYTYQDAQGQAVWSFHSPPNVPMNSPCSCSNYRKEKEKVAETKYYCQGYQGETYNKNGCKIHNSGAAMTTPCACDDYKEKTEIVWETKYFCPGYFVIVDDEERLESHNGGEAMDKPCSCADVEEHEIPVSTTYYYCQGYCPGNHRDYTCEGHSETICYGEHQDVTITVTSLGFDDIFYADSALAADGSYIMGDAYEEKFVVTAYCACHECCHPYDEACTGNPPKTASGTTPKASHTIAVDPAVIPLGTHVWINGKEYVAEDTGGAIDGLRIDMFFDSHQQASNWGTRKLTVYKSATVESDVETKDKHGFAGWTEDNIELVKGIYEGLTNDEANEVYAGLDGIYSLSYGSGSSFDFTGVDFGELDTSTLTTKQMAIISVIENNQIATRKGYCQAWVADVYMYAQTGTRASKCCANHAGEAWGVSNNWGDIQVGATVYGYSSSQYGHVGIYIGNGMVAHNIGYLKVESLERWVKTYNGQCWGWNGGYNLSGNSAYNCKPAGTFMQGRD